MISQIMCQNVICVDLDAPLKQAQLLCQEHGFHHLPVLENQKLVGIVSDRDILRALSPFLGTLSENNRDLLTLERPVHQIMSYHPITAPPDAEVTLAISLMQKHRISSLPIVDSTKKVLGIITDRDLLFHLASSLPEEDPKSV